jgi:hypothetical protein
MTKIENTILYTQYKSIHGETMIYYYEETFRIITIKKRDQISLFYFIQF